jgi:flagellar basal-body rod protein FlgF
MDNASYVTLTRQTGLLREMTAIANNLANLSTTGYRREGTVFAEHVRRTGGDGASLSMAAALGRYVDSRPGALDPTGGTFDFALDGPGFFTVETAEGPRLTRAGSFTPNAEGELVAPDGARLLDAGGAPVFVPPDARSVTLAPDGTLSADGRPVAQLAAVLPADPAGLIRAAGSRFEAPGGTLPAEGARFLQGFLEGSNVEPVREIVRLSEVQRAYELAQGFLDREDERIRSVIRVFAR